MSVKQRKVARIFSSNFGSIVYKTDDRERLNAGVLVTAASQNVKRLLAFRGRGPRKLAQAAALRPPQTPSVRLNLGSSRRHRRLHRTLFIGSSTGWQAKMRDHRARYDGPERRETSSGSDGLDPFTSLSSPLV